MQPMRHLRRTHATRLGTSMIELLVVIVVFLVGILAIIQVFPGGLKVIARTRSVSMANQLARSESERLRGVADTLPEMILPVRYHFDGSQVLIGPDPTRDPNDLGAVSEIIDAQGSVLDGANNVLGDWDYLSGPNVFRRIIGEGGPIPAVRRIGGESGGLLTLKFGPMYYNSASNNLKVYGSDLVRLEGDPGTSRVVDYEYSVQDAESATAILHLPAETARTYRISLVAWFDVGGKVERRHIFGASVNVAATPGTFYQLDVADVPGVGVPGFIGVEFESIRVQREYLRVGSFSGDPYEYRILDGALGLLLFPQEATTTFERRSEGGRVPLTARVDYDVLDWRIIRDEFRVPDISPSQYKLKLPNVLLMGRMGADSRSYEGLDVPVQVAGSPLGSTERRDVIVLDLETGGIYQANSFAIDTSFGTINFLDGDGDGTNGVQASLVLPGSTVASDVNVGGRTVRAYYRVRGEWSVHVQKAADQFRQVLATPGPAECYVGGSAAYLGSTPLSGSEGLTRIYFPRMDAGKKVTLAKAYYEDGSGNVKELSGQDFLIQSTPADATGLPYIDIQTVATDAVSFNFDQYGYAVRGVRGGSISVRVLWNPEPIQFTSDTALNLQRFEAWGRSWNRVSMETVIQREVSP